MAVPKRKVSKGRRNRRRAHHALTKTYTVRCLKCGEDKLPHRICQKCGSYARNSPQSKRTQGKS